MRTETAGPTGGERRAHIRWSPPTSDFRIKLYVGEAIHDCRLKDISAGGAALVANSAIQINSPVVLELSGTLRLPGSVYRNRSGAIVVKFDLQPTMVRQVDQAIQLGLAPAEW